VGKEQPDIDSYETFVLTDWLWNHMVLVIIRQSRAAAAAVALQSASMGRASRFITICDFKGSQMQQHVLQEL
jgi:hypothetical protein